MPTSLSIATMGHMPVRTPFTLATMGLLDDPNAVAAASDYGGAQFHVEPQKPQEPQPQNRNPNPFILRDWNKPPAGVAEVRTVEVDGEAVEIEIPAWKPLASPVNATAPPISEIADGIDRELARELRVAAIRQHAQETAESLNKHRKLENEIMVAVTLLVMD